jgi:GDPmannose 4,6-dehydratase
MSLDDRRAIGHLVGDGAYDQIYYLAACHQASQDPVRSTADVVRRSFATHMTGLLNVLDAMVVCRSRRSLFYAASSHIFGIFTNGPQTEATRFAPFCAYGISKAAGARNRCEVFLGSTSSP